ncbi:MAG: glycogen synthase GlgA [Bacteroidota bacterium]|nr:glycogen synthase GlgA [Bacteroidota bacterium]
MKIAFVASECFPYVKTGGLGDVVGSLPNALAEEGNEVILFLPLYSGIKKEEHKLNFLTEFQDIPVRIGDKEVVFNLWYGSLPDSEVEVYFVDCPAYFHRQMPYTDDADEDERFILFQIAVFETLQRLKWSPDVIHCNDWQTSLVPVYMKTNYKWDKLFEKTTTLLSIHNIGYQGRFSSKSIHNAGISNSQYYPGGPYELDNTFCFLKAGILFSEIITTVSPTYAKEIQTDEFGAGMEGVLSIRKDDIYGVLNGIDTNIWNPKVDKFISHNYTKNKLANKIRCKKELLKEAGIKYNEDIPVIGIISRFAGQKGFDLMFPVINELMALDFQLIILGSGDDKTEKFFELLTANFPEKVNAYIGYNNKLAHWITAGSDIFLMPSKYEPCGLNQMYCLNYGTVPVVRKTGGLADTVKDSHDSGNKGNGFTFDDYTPYALYSTIERALDIFKDRKIWKEIMQRGMKEDFSWKQSAKEYMRLYRKAERTT